MTPRTESPARSRRRRGAPTSLATALAATALCLAALIAGTATAAQESMRPPEEIAGARGQAIVQRFLRLRRTPPRGENVDQAFLDEVEALMAEVDVERLDATDIVRIGDTMLFRYVPAARDRALARLVQLSARDDAEGAIALLAIVSLTNPWQLPQDERELVEAPRREAGRRALAHPALAEGLRTFRSPDDLMRNLASAADPADLLDAAPDLPIDLPIEVASSTPSELHERLRLAFPEEQAAGLEAARRRLVEIVASALNRVTDDAELRAMLVRRHPAAADVPDDVLEQHRRHHLARLDTELARLLGPVARGRALGMPFDRLAFDYGRLPSEDGVIPISSSGDLGRRPLVVLHAPLSELMQGSAFRVDALRAVHAPLADAGVEALLVVSGYVGTRHMGDPEAGPHDPARELETLIERFDIDCAVGLVGRNDLIGTVLGDGGGLVAVDRAGRVVAMERGIQFDPDALRRIADALGVELPAPAPGAADGEDDAG